MRLSLLPLGLPLGMILSLVSPASQAQADFPSALKPEAYGGGLSVTAVSPAKIEADHQAAIKAAQEIARRRAAELSVDQAISPVLPVFHFPPETETKLKALISERIIEAWSAARQDAVAQADANIRELVGPARFPRIAALMAAHSELSQIASYWAPEFASEGDPLSPEQRLALALAQHEHLTAHTQWKRINPGKEAEPLDAEGLSEADRRMLAKLEGQLSSRQLDGIRRSLYFTECAIHHVPIAFSGAADLPPDASAQIEAAEIKANPNYGRVLVDLHGSARARARLKARAFGDDHRVFRATPYDYTPCNRQGSPALMVCTGGAALFDDQGKLVRLVNESELEWLDGKPHAKSPFDAQ